MCGTKPTTHLTFSPHEIELWLKWGSHTHGQMCIKKCTPEPNLSSAVPPFTHIRLNLKNSEKHRDPAGCVLEQSILSVHKYKHFCCHTLVCACVLYLKDNFAMLYTVCNTFIWASYVAILSLQTEINKCLSSTMTQQWNSTVQGNLHWIVSHFFQLRSDFKNHFSIFQFIILVSHEAILSLKPIWK